MPAPFCALAAAAFLAAGPGTAPPRPSPAKAVPKKAVTQTYAPRADEFQKQVPSLLAKSCTPCHNDRMASGSLSLRAFSSPQSLIDHRDAWEKIAHKIRTGEMPPKGIPRPAQAQVDSLLAYLNSEFERADSFVKPDPGRVTARRLNRIEYTHTIRDLLAVDFRADKSFPADDSGYGFDNIGDVLTISPMLMDKYVNAAERIAARALGSEKLPKPVEVEYHTKDKNLSRLDVSTVEASHRIDFDAEYIVRIGLPGERKDGKPVTLNFWMDGKLLHAEPVETKPSGLVYFNPYSEVDFKLVLPEGEHVFRAGFTNDDFVRTLDPSDHYKQNKNKYLNMIKIIGPFPAKVEKASRRKILICDPNTGLACQERIVATLARRAWRRPVKPAEVAQLMRFVAMAKADGASPEQSLQLAIQAILVSPHFLFRIERDAAPNDPDRVHKISDLELASRLSYFLWSSMPDDELLSLAEANRLRAPGVLSAQLKRMLSDPKAAAFAENFAGQWLETRNLKSVKPDPQKFPEWSPELRDAMATETRLFFEYLLRENRPLTEFLDAPYTFLNERLARHYGIPGVTGPDFRKVDLAGPQRGGILGHASVLTVSSYPSRTSPVIRGKYVLQNILGAPPPAPPPDVPTLDEEAVGNAGSLRQQMEKHRTNATCASCHARMDALGFGLENYDAIGRWRAVDGKFPIDASGTLPNGKTFGAPNELRTLLKDDMSEFLRCLTEKMMTYGLGRGLERYDRKAVLDVQKRVAASGYKFQTLVEEIVTSLPFQARRGEFIRSQSTSKGKEIAQR